MAATTLALLGGIGAAGATSTGLIGTIGAALPSLSTIGTIGSILGAGGAVLGGVKANQAAKFEARQMREAGDAAGAEAQRKALGAKRQKKLLLSTVRARAAASGAGETGNVDAIMEGIEQQGEYNALSEYFSGSSQRNKAYASAYSREKSGKDALISGFISGGTKLARGGRNFYDY